MPGKIVGKVTSLLVVTVLLSVPLSVQPCRMSEVSNNPCCCCSGSPDFSRADHREQQERGCHRCEKHQEGSSPAVIVFHHDDRSLTPFVASEVKLTVKDYHTQLTGLCRLPLLLTSKDPPLYLLHSSFLI